MDSENGLFNNIKNILPLAIGAASSGCLIPLIIFVVIITTIFIGAGIFDDDNPSLSSSSNGGICIYKVNGENVSDVKVRLMNCDGNGAVPGEELVDFETYITGVVYQEIGSSSYEALKAQAVAARSYALTRPKKMGNSLGTSLKYTDGQWILSLRSCTLDQVYCDPNKGCWSNRTGGQTGDKSTWSNSTVHSGQDTSKNWSRGPLAEDSDIRKAVEETRGEVLLNAKGNIVYTTFVASTQTKWNNLAKNGKDYFSILTNTYKSGKKVEANCTITPSDSSTSIDLASIKTTNNINKIFKGDFEKFLKKNNSSKSKYNEYIYNSVKKAGLGTNNGVAAAGISLIDYMANFGYKLKYSWGGSYDGYGVKDFGTSGFDCSHFVAWAIHNGGFKWDYRSSSGWKKVGNTCKRTSKSCNGKVGDLIWHEGHIMLIVGVDNNNYYIAQAQSSKAGITLTKQEKYRNMWSKTDYIVDMSSYYASHKDTSKYPS